MTPYNPMSLGGKTILITGATSGIGRAIAVECAKLGAHAILTGRNEEGLKETASLLEGAPHTILVADINDEAQREQLVASLPKLDGISHNAGVGNTMLCAFAKPETVQHVVETNLLSPVALQNLILKKKKIRKNGSIVFMASIGSQILSLGNAFYGLSKGGLVSYAKGLAVEMGSKGIRVNCIQPGMVETKLIHRAALDQSMFDKDVERYPLGRYGRPADIAHLAAFLLSDAAAWITGSCYIIDGGRTLS